jgi:hypothetical protein
MEAASAGRRVFLTRDEIMQDLIEMIGELETDWDVDLSQAGPDSGLMSDLGCDSQGVVMLRESIEGRYGRDDIPFENLLIRDSAFVSDIRLGDIVELLERHLNGGGAEA